MKIISTPQTNMLAMRITSPSMQVLDLSSAKTSRFWLFRLRVFDFAWPLFGSLNVSSGNDFAPPSVRVVPHEQAIVVPN